jgi:tetraacyldisaccharide 4'-kinase
MRAPEFWRRDDAFSRLLTALLTPIGWLYGASVAWRARNTQPFRIEAKVICVGNLTAGGSGKTPVAIAVAQALAAGGLKVMFLSRGYGGRARGPMLVDADVHDAGDVGDEPLLLSREGQVIVARDRHEGAEFADSFAPDVIVMDDGHQNFALAKDLSLVVVDAAGGFGNGRMLPAGPLREPVAQGLKRADAVILVGDGTPPLGAWAGPLLRAHLAPKAGNAFVGRKVVAFAGIAQPEKFLDSLKGCGALLVDSVPFGDHHAYSAAEIARLKAKARANDAGLVTTEKDFVRLTKSEREGIEVLPVEALFDDPSALAALLDRLGPNALAPAPA